MNLRADALEPGMVIEGLPELAPAASPARYRVLSATPRQRGQFVELVLEGAVDNPITVWAEAVAKVVDDE